MSEEIVLLYPPNPFVIEPIKPNMKKDIKIILYNKTYDKILYKISSNDKNILKNDNPISILKPLSSQNITINLFNNTKTDLNEIKYEIIFCFYILNKGIAYPSNLNNIIKEKIGKENQKNVVNIHVTKKAPNNDDQYMKNYIKFENDLNDINKKIKDILDNPNPNKYNNNNKLIFVIILLLIIIIFGFLLGIKLSKIYNRLFKSKVKENKVNNNNDDDKDFVEVKFMSVKEADVINEIVDDNLLKYNKLNDFNMFNELQKNRKIKQEELKKEETLKKQKILNKTNKEEKKHYSFINYFLTLIMLLIIIFI